MSSVANARSKSMSIFSCEIESLRSALSSFARCTANPTLQKVTQHSGFTFKIFKIFNFNDGAGICELLSKYTPRNVPLNRASKEERRASSLSVLSRALAKEEGATQRERGRSALEGKGSRKGSGE